MVWAGTEKKGPMFIPNVKLASQPFQASLSLQEKAEEDMASRGALCFTNVPRVKPCLFHPQFTFPAFSGAEL